MRGMFRSTTSSRVRSDAASAGSAAFLFPAGVTVLQDSATGNDEGRAMLQLIYDSAPASTLYFATANGGQANFANNIKALRNNGAKVITDDVIYFAEPMFQDGILAAAVDDVVSTGVSYFSSANNQARQAYESQFRSGVSRAEGSIANTTGPHFFGGLTHDFAVPAFDRALDPIRWHETSDVVFTARKAEARYGAMVTQPAPWRSCVPADIGSLRSHQMGIGIVFEP